METSVKFRVWFSKERRMIYLGSIRNDTALWLEERGWDAVDHLMGKPESICSNYKNENPENKLQQWTELCDKNGKEIYDGDILKGNHKDNFYIERINGGLQMINARYYGQQHNELIAMPTCDPQTKSWLLNAEVIGNICETSAREMLQTS